MEEQNYILFESYLSGELTPQESAVFELRLANEPDFAEAFNTYKALNSFLKNKFENETAENAFKDNLDRISKAHFETIKTQEGSKMYIKVLKLYPYAMVACILLLVGIFVFNPFAKPSYNDYNDFAPISLTVRGENDMLLKDAETAFNTKNFEKAEIAFKRLLEIDEDNVELKLYRALVNLEINNFIIADALLYEISKGESVYKNTAIWYLGLSKLKQKDIQACIEVLKTLPQDADEYEQAQDLIGKLS